MVKKKSKGRKKPQCFLGPEITIIPPTYTHTHTHTHTTRNMLSRDAETLLDVSPQNDAMYRSAQGKRGEGSRA